MIITHDAGRVWVPNQGIGRAPQGTVEKRGVSAPAHT